LRLVHNESARLFVALASLCGASEALGSVDAAHVYEQRQEGMGERLCGAFEDAFARGACNPVLIGSDSPTLPGELIASASRALEAHDVVIGPAVDGGYYLIGLRRPCPRLFEGIDWSTDRVLAQTQQRAREAGLAVFYLPYWYDIDTAADLELLKQDARPGSAVFGALRTIGP